MNLAVLGLVQGKAVQGHDTVVSSGEGTAIMSEQTEGARARFSAAEPIRPSAFRC